MKKKKAKKIPVGWKKDHKNYIYYFKETVAKTYRIKKIQFIGFTKIPVGLSLYKTGGGFNFRQSNKIGGTHFLSFLESKYKRSVNLTIFSNGNGSKSFKLLKRSVDISLLFENFIEILKDLGDEIKEKRNEVVQKRLAEFFPKELNTGKETTESTSTRLGDINLNNLNDADHEAVGHFIKKYISLNADNDKVLGKLQTDLVIQGRKKNLDQVIKKFEKYLKDRKYDEKKWQKFLHEEVFFFISNYIESIREANVNFGKT